MIVVLAILDSEAAKMDKSEFQGLIQLGEGRSLEFKRSTSWNDKGFKANIAKSILAFSNVRDGGRIVVGVEQKDDGGFNPVGMTEEHLVTWNYDNIASYVSEFADPFVEFSLERVDVDLMTFLLITILEFRELPVVCKRDGNSRLRKGAIYTRTYRMPESAEVPSQTELREILDLATEKKIRLFHTMASRVGLTVPIGPSDSERFNQQLGDF